LTPAATAEIVDDGDHLSAVNACDYGAAEFFDPTTAIHVKVACYVLAEYFDRTRFSSN